MTIKGFISFPFLPRIWQLGSRLQIQMSMGRLRRRIGNSFWNCTDLNKKLLKTDQIKATVLTWQLNMNFKVWGFSQTFHIDLLTDGCNVHGLESHWNKIVFTHEVTIFSVVGAQLTSKFFSVNDPFWVSLFILLKTKVLLYSGTYRLHITADGPYHNQGVDVFDLNKIFLKNRINNIKTLALLRTWKLVSKSISFKKPCNVGYYFPNSSQIRIQSASFGIPSLENCIIWYTRSTRG